MRIRDLHKQDKISKNWIVLLSILIIFFICQFPLRQVLEHLPIKSGTPEAIWNLIARDFRKSIASLVGLMASIFLLIPSLKSRKLYTWAILIICFIYYGVSIGDGIMILLNTEHMYNPDTATTTWINPQDYKSNFWNRLGSLCYLGLLGLFYLMFYLKRKQEHSNR